MKPTNYQFATASTLSLGALLFTGFASAGPLSLPNVPLAVSTTVSPNVMLMLDNSGSMLNVVPDAPYNPNVTYACSGATVWSTSNSVDLFVTSGGSPFLRQGTSGTTYYDWGTGSGNGLTNRAKRCFNPAGTYNARLYADSGNNGAQKSPGSYLPAEYTGNYLNWYFGYSTTNSTYGSSAVSFGSDGRSKQGTQTRMFIAQSAGRNLVDTMSSAMRVGLSTYNNGDGGTLLESIANLTDTKRTSLKTKITNLTPSGATPLAETLSDIGRYFAIGTTTNLTLHPGKSNSSTATVSQVFNSHTLSGSSGATAPIQYSCQKSFAVLMTDGRPQQDRAISSYIRDYTGDCAAGLCIADSNTTNIPSGDLTSTSYANGTKIGRSYESQGSDYLDDVAAALYDIDLRPDLVDPLGKKNNVATYLISFAEEAAINDPLMQDTVTRGGGQFFVAGNENELSQAFQAALSSIMDQSGASAAATANTGFVGSGARVYQARYSSLDWSGQLLAFAVDNVITSSTYGLLLTNGTGPAGSLWDAGALIPASNNRNIFTRNGTGVPFTWSSLSEAQQTLLGSANILNYIRGDDTLEQKNAGGTYRTRSTKLGDVLGSAPAYVGPPAFGYRDTIETTSYSSFRITNANRTPVVYVGANDGMLHGFNANTGAELMAYVPSKLFGTLSTLASPSYNHRYYVDGSPTVVDAFINSQWRTVLVGGLGRGGQSIYALDVTDPSIYSNANAAATAAAISLWEFSDTNDADLGYTYSQPAIVKLQNGVWAAIFGNGYNNTEADGAASTTGNAVLYVVNLHTGALIKKISTEQGTAQDPTGQARPNGLASVTAIDLDGDFMVDYVYAGDLFGNLWKFNLDNSNPNQWDVAYKTGSTPKPLFTACRGTSCTTGSSSNAQAITSAPTVGRHPSNNGVMVYFGTGKYLETTDNDGAAGGVQSFYGLWDKGSMISGRSTLQSQSILLELGANTSGNPFNYDLRVTSNNSINWTSQLGWYMDLVSPGNVERGERQITNSVLRNNRIIFTTTIPSTDPCLPGGSSWLMEMDAVSGSRLVYSPFDLNGDRAFTSADFVTVTIGDEQVQVPVSGVKTSGGGAATPNVMATEEGEVKCISTSAGMECIRENPGPKDTSRQSWKQLGL